MRHVWLGSMLLLGFVVSPAGWSADNNPARIEGMLSAQTEAQLECVFAHLPQQPAFRTIPLLRAQQNLLQGKVDGYFGMTFDPAVTDVAEASPPLLIRKWNTYSYDAQLLDKDLSDPQLKIGVLDGGNPLSWLQDQGISPHLKVGSTEQLLELLFKGRVNVVLTDQSSMTQALLSAPELPQPTQQFQRFVPLSVYFSKQYLALHPDFMPDFARSISQCQVQAPSLSPEQKLQLQEWAASYLNDWRKQSALLHTLRAAAKAARPSLAVLQQADETWLNEQQQKLQPLISQVLESPLSVKLKGMVSDDARLSEGLLADVYGRLLAASDITTDFYQGDEYWFQGCEALPESELLVGPIEYDESTKQLAARVSGAILDPTSKAFLGVVALNINVDQL